MWDLNEMAREIGKSADGQQADRKHGAAEQQPEN
jgi:hypothetical protein